MDALYPAANPLGIPDLDPDRQPDCVPLPVWGWGSTSRDREHRGTWHFFTDDFRWSRLLKDPSALVETGAAAAVEPNISVFDDTPKALAIASIYRKRWIARFWQLAGVRVFVDCNLPARILDSAEARMGIPEGWRAFATRGYDRRLEDLGAEYQFASSFGIRKPVFLVIGGGAQVAAWCERTPGAVHSGYQRSKRVHSCNGGGVPAFGLQERS
jgi:hypothetical protein